MNRLIKLALSTLLLLAASYQSRASHQAGHDLTYVYVGDSAGLQHYRVTLTLFIDCLNGSPGAIADDNPAFIGIFQGSTRVVLDTSAFFTSSVPLIVSRYGPCDSSWSTVPGCVLKKTFVRNYYLPPSATGYTISYQRCCMNAAISNVVDPGSNGITAACSIPPSSVATNNNSAVFTNYPPYVIADNFPFTFDFSATDADGDSLSYSFCGAMMGVPDPSNAKPYPASPPYDTIAYISPTSADSPIIASAAFHIDSITGLMTGTPSQQGRYLVAVRCDEWRGGVHINSIQRDFEVIVFDCFEPLRKIYHLGPNPATNQLMISSTEYINNVSVFDSKGKHFDLPWTTSGSSPTNPAELLGQVDISTLQAGEYLLRINDGEALEFIKQW